MGLFRKMLFFTGGSTVVLGGGAAVVYQRRLKENKSVTGEDYNAMQVQDELLMAVASLKHGTNKSRGGEALATPVNLYRYTTCPFCGKVKALLDYHGVPHECIEVEPMFKSQIKESKYKKVPQLQFWNGKSNPYLVDSDIVVDKLGAILGHEKELTDPEVLKWREWARSSLVRHIVVNINPTLKDAWAGYGYIDNFDTIPQFNKTFLKVMGAPVMYMVSEMMTKPKLKKMGELNKGDDIQAVLRGQVNRFVSEGLQNGGADATLPYHGGSKPDLADLDIYGVMQSIRGHKVYEDLIENTTITPWLSAMDKATKKEDPCKVRQVTKD